MKELLIVDENDNVIGKETREKAHSGEGILHRANAAFVFNDKGELLIAQRSSLKQLWPECWDNTCCTHVYEGESYERSAEIRLKEELGFTTKLNFLLKFQYQINYGDAGSENEICGVIIGNYNGEVRPNPEEVMDYKWVSVKDIKDDMDTNPEKYTPWFRIGFARYLEATQ